MFYDFNVIYTNDKEEREKIVVTAIRLGYQGIVWNEMLEESPQKDFRCRMQLEPIDEKNDTPIQSNILRLEKQEPKFRQLKRLTVIADSDMIIRTVVRNVALCKSYDIMAFCPTTEARFLTCAANLGECDILSFDFSKRMPFYFKRSTVLTAINNSLMFEICFSASITDKTSRQILISNVQTFLRASKGRNIILSSAAKKAFYMRGPYDVINLGVMLGLNRTQAKDAISKNCQSALVNAASRQMTRGQGVKTHLVEELDEQQRWKKPRLQYEQQPQGEEEEEEEEEEKGSKTPPEPAGRNDRTPDVDDMCMAEAAARRDEKEVITITDDRGDSEMTD